MPTSLSIQIQDVLPRIRDAFYKLILAVGPARAGKTKALVDLSALRGWPRLNLNLQIAEQLLDLTHRQRAVRVASIVEDAIRNQNSDIVLVDNIELLFAVELAQDPLRLLQTVSRNQTIIAAWPGGFDGAFLTYAEPGHPEARRYPAPQAVIVKAGDANEPDGESREGETT